MIKDQKRGHWGEVMDLIKKAKVRVVFLGHIHLYDEMDIRGTKYIISAGEGHHSTVAIILENRNMVLSWSR